MSIPALLGHMAKRISRATEILCHNCDCANIDFLKQNDLLCHGGWTNLSQGNNRWTGHGRMYQSSECRSGKHVLMNSHEPHLPVIVKRKCLVSSFTTFCSCCC